MLTKQRKGPSKNTCGNIIKGRNFNNIKYGIIKNVNSTNHESPFKHASETLHRVASSTQAAFENTFD